MNRELPDVQAGFRKGRRTRDQIANIYWIIEKARELKKNIYFCFIDYAKTLIVDHKKLWNIFQEMGIPETTLSASWEACVQVRKQQLEPGMEQRTGSKLSPAYLTCMQSASRERGWMKHRLCSRLLGE